ncbi:MAG: hypothetical protein JNK12_05280 [Acidimicrobiales bacterium]|nr:hypothetical protein [Acidimicrobiales bacterium]
MPDIDPDSSEARSLGRQLADEADAFNHRMGQYRLRFEATHFGPGFTEVEWQEVAVVDGRRLVATCPLDGRTARAVVDQSAADGSWSAYALAGDWADGPVHRLRSADGQWEAQSVALAAAWAVLDPVAFENES